MIKRGVALVIAQKRECVDPLWREGSVVVREHAQWRPTQRNITLAVTTVLGLMAATGVQAACGNINSTTTITGPYTGSCDLQSGAYNLVVTNTGSVEGSANAVQVMGNVNGTIENNGVIIGSERGIQVVSNSIGDISNAGTISGQDYGIEANFSGVIGNIMNQVGGTISSHNNGIYASSDSTFGNITNRGTISADNGDGIFIASDNSHVGNIINSGTIAGGSHSINIENSALSGEIQVEGDNTARFNGAVNAISYTMRVMNGAVYSVLGDEQFTVSSMVNDGRLRLANNANSTAHIMGDFTTVGTLLTQVTDTGYGKLSVSGAVTLGGNLVIDASTLTKANTYSNGLLVSVVQGTSVTGQFAEVSDNSVLFDFTPKYNGNSLDLELVSAHQHGIYDAVNAFGDRSGIAAAHVLDQIITNDPGNALSSLFVPLSDTASVATAVSQVLPKLQGSLQHVNTGMQNQVSRLLSMRLGALRGAVSGEDFAASPYFWIKGFGTNADQNQRRGYAGYNATTYGMMMGTDMEPSEHTRLGLAFTYARSGVDGSDTASTNSANVQSYQFTGYGSHDLSDDSWLDFYIGAGQNRNQGRRKILFADRVAKSSFDSNTISAGLGLNHQLNLSSNSSFTHSIRADYYWLSNEGYTEREADVLNLKVKRNTSEALILSVDGKLSYRLDNHCNLMANLGMGYDVIHDQPSVVAMFVGSSNSAFNTPGISQSPWMVRAGLGLAHDVTEKLELSARYDAEHREAYMMQTASLKLKWSF